MAITQDYTSYFVRSLFHHLTSWHFVCSLVSRFRVDWPLPWSSSMSKLFLEDGFNSPQRTADPLKAEPQIPLCRLFKNNHTQAHP